MENGKTANWNFKGDETVKKASGWTIKFALKTLRENLNANDKRAVIPLGYGDPSQFPSFKPSKVAEEAVIDAIQSGKFHCYAPGDGTPEAKRAIADHLSLDHGMEISPKDVFLTLGGRQAIDIMLTVLARPGANILLPKPGYSFYEARATFSQLEIRHYDLLPEQGWEVDLSHVEALADDKTVAIAIVNPGNPCGNVYTYEHLQKVAETARKLGFLVIADEAYAHLTFGKNPSVPMRVFSSIVPVLTLGSLSKRYMLPGWRLGWLVTSDQNGILQRHGIIDSIKSCLDITPEPVNFIQAALPKMLKEIPEDYHLRTLNLLRETADVCYDRLKDIPCFICPYKPEGSMFVMVKLNLSLLEGINNDMEFSLKLANEESVVVLPGYPMGLKNWLRVTFAVELSLLEDGLERIRAFCARHAKKQ